MFYYTLRRRVRPVWFDAQELIWLEGYTLTSNCSGRVVIISYLERRDKELSSWDGVWMPIPGRAPISTR
jgi:hypothetical protein